MTQSANKLALIRQTRKQVRMVWAVLNMQNINENCSKCVRDLQRVSRSRATGMCRLADPRGSSRPCREQPFRRTCFKMTTKSSGKQGKVRASGWGYQARYYSSSTNHDSSPALLISRPTSEAGRNERNNSTSASDQRLSLSNRMIDNGLG